MKTKVLNLDNKAAGDVELNDAIFGLEPRQDLIQRVVVWQLAKRRAGTHKILTRAEVNRTKKKLYKQKGTGQARHGARSAPLFVGGAKAMGPVNHSHEFDLPKKVKALGLKHALSSKAKSGSLVILDEAKSKDIKTKALAEQFGTAPRYRILRRWQLRLAGWFSRTVRDAAELLPRYEVDNIFVSDKFKTRFPDFRATTFREGLAAIRDEHFGGPVVAKY